MGKTIALKSMSANLLSSDEDVKRLVVPRLAKILSDAFFSDPFFNYIMPNESKRPRQLDWWMRSFLNYGLRHGEVHVTRDPRTQEFSGAALWFGPDAPIPNEFRIAWAGLYQGPIRLGPRNCSRMIAVTNQWQRLHHHEPKTHWYLNTLGVAPQNQGQGHGRALIEAVTRKADAVGLNCYLETAKAANVKLYERYGFKVVHEQNVGAPANSWKFWTMRREATGPRNI